MRTALLFAKAKELPKKQRSPEALVQQKTLEGIEVRLASRAMQRDRGRGG